MTNAVTDVLIGALVYFLMGVLLIPAILSVVKNALILPPWWFVVGILVISLTGSLIGVAARRARRAK